MTWDAYLLLKTAGIVVFVFIGSFYASKNGFSLAKSLVITACAVMLGFIFSRGWFILQHAFGSEPYAPETFTEAWNDAGSVLYGWVSGGTLAIWLLCKAWKLKPVQFLDYVLPWLLFAQALNRFGCFAGECCWGSETTFFVHVWNSWVRAEVHPVQIYEAVFDISLFILCFKKARRPGSRTFLYFFGYPAGRFFFEFLRGDNQSALLFLTVPQVASLVILTWTWLLYKSKSFRAKHLSFQRH